MKYTAVDFSVLCCEFYTKKHEQVLSFKQKSQKDLSFGNREG